MLDNVVSNTSPPLPAQSSKSHGSLDADIIIKNAPDPVFVSDLEGKILSANDAVYELLGFRTDEVLEQSLSRFISPEETREFTAALREVIERGVIRNTRLNPRSASGEVIPTSLNASALRDSDGKVIGAIGILRDMRELDKALAYSDSLIKNAPDPVFVSDLEGKILQANDAVYELLGFRTDEVLEQSLSRFISPEETREFLAALRDGEEAAHLLPLDLGQAEHFPLQGLVGLGQAFRSPAQVARRADIAGQVGEVAHEQCSENPPKKNAVLELERNFEICKYQGDHENIVH